MALFCAGQGIAGAATAGPLSISSCVVARGAAMAAFGIPHADTEFTDGVTVVVKNTSTKQIVSSVLSGTYDGVVITDTVKAPLAGGATATWSKKHTPLVYNGPNASCRVDRVDFADGTSWTAPPAPM